MADTVKIVMVKNENNARISKVCFKRCSENCRAYKIKKVRHEQEIWLV